MARGQRQQQSYRCQAAAGDSFRHTTASPGTKAQSQQAGRWRTPPFAPSVSSGRSSMEAARARSAARSFCGQAAEGEVAGRCAGF